MSLICHKRGLVGRQQSSGRLELISSQHTHTHWCAAAAAWRLPLQLPSPLHYLLNTTSSTATPTPPYAPLLLRRIITLRSIVRPTATDGVARSVCMLVTTVSCANCRTDRDSVCGEVGEDLCGSKEPSLRQSAHWRHLANTNTSARRQCDLSN